MEKSFRLMAVERDIGRIQIEHDLWRLLGMRLGQLLANLGASFPADRRIFHPLSFAGKLGWSVGPNGDQSGPQATGPSSSPMPPSPKPEEAGSPGYYYPDYRTDFPMGDNPYRYSRW